MIFNPDKEFGPCLQKYKNFVIERQGGVWYGEGGVRKDTMPPIWNVYFDYENGKKFNMFFDSVEEAKKWIDKKT